MLARRFSMICILTAVLGIYAAIHAADIDPTHTSGISCEGMHIAGCQTR